MFCPTCAAKNLDGASYCRSCGANISLIPQALSGQMTQTAPDEIDPDSREGRRHARRYGRSGLSLDHAFKNVFMGIAFLLVAVALAFSRMGGGWWFWMLIPAFSMMGTGIAQYIRLKERDKRALPVGNSIGNMGQPAIQSPQRYDSFAAPNTGELLAPPPSVTEGTTRHLGAEAPTKHFSSDEVPK